MIRWLGWCRELKWPGSYDILERDAVGHLSIDFGNNLGKRDWIRALRGASCPEKSRGRRSMNEDHLDSELWLIELSEFVEECDRDDPLDVRVLLRRFHTLLTFAPKEWGHLFRSVPDRATFDALLDSEALESAAIRLLGPNTGYMLSRSAGGEALASVWTPIACDEVHAKGHTEPVALIKALAMATFFGLCGVAKLNGKFPLMISTGARRQ